MEILEKLKEFDNSLDTNSYLEAEATVTNILRRVFQTLFRKDGAPEKGYRFILEHLKDPFWEQMFFEHVSPQVICADSFAQDFKTTNPEIYQELVLPLIQKALTSKERGYSRAIVRLAYNGSEDFLKEPMFLRLSAPYQVGTSNKGRSANLPQKDGVYLVYNADELRSGYTSDALVWDEERVTTFSLEETRAKIIKNGSLVRMCVMDGIYNHPRSGCFPVQGCQPNWVVEFRTFILSFLGSRLKDEVCRLSDSDLSSLERLAIEHFEATLDNFISQAETQAQAFYCNLTPKKYYLRFMRNRFVRELLMNNPIGSKIYSEHVERVLSNMNHPANSVLTKMTS